jgi:hypothetical protein
MKAPDFAGTVRGNEMQAKLAVVFQSQQNNLRRLAQYLIYGQIKLERLGTDVQIIPGANAEATSLFRDWAQIAVVRDGMKFLATLQGLSRVSHAQVPEVEDLIVQTLAGGDRPREELEQKFGVLPQFRARITSQTTRDAGILQPSTERQAQAGQSCAASEANRPSGVAYQRRGQRSPPRGTGQGRNRWD